MHGRRCGLALLAVVLVGGLPRSAHAANQRTFSVSGDGQPCRMVADASADHSTPDDPVRRAGSAAPAARFTAFTINEAVNLALRSDGHVFGWGFNEASQLGDGTTINRHRPEDLSAISGSALYRVQITSLAIGYAHTMLVGSAGHVYAWGDNVSGDLGDGTTTARNRPEDISAPSGSPLHGVQVTTLAAGAFHNLGLGSDGHVYAWGGNDNGELGDGTTIDQSRPEDISALSGSPLQGVRVIALAAGADHSLALGSNGHVYAWGANVSGDLGDGTTTERHRPEDISVLSGSPLHGVRVTAISAGDVQDLALGSNGHVYAWGDNSYGNLGDGTTSEQHRPEDISTLSGSSLHGVRVTTVVAGDVHDVALGSNGHVYTWGSNRAGQLGDGTTTWRYRPEDISAISRSSLHGVRVTILVADDLDNLALGSNGHVYTWGENDYGQLGDGTTTERHSPVDISAGLR